MNPTPFHEDVPPRQDQPDDAPEADYFTEIAVHSGILHATAETLELLHDFFTETEPSVRMLLGRFLIKREPDEDTGDPALEATLAIYELSEVADLLHTLADSRTNTNGQRS